MKSKVLIAAVLISSLIGFFAFKKIEDDGKERVYKLEIPQSQVQPFWALTHGQEDQLTMGQYKALMKYIEVPLQQQAYDYHIQDSLAAIKPKK